MGALNYINSTFVVACCVLHGTTHLLREVFLDVEPARGVDERAAQPCVTHPLGRVLQAEGTLHRCQAVVRLVLLHNTNN